MLLTPYSLKNLKSLMNCVSETVMSGGTVLSPFLFTPLTSAKTQSHATPLQERPELVLLPAESQRLKRLQQDSADVLPVCGGQRYLLCCYVLRMEREGKRC